MLKSEKNSVSNNLSTDRRACPRLPIRSVAYIELDGDNAGLILNVSERGIGVQSAEIISGERFERMILRLPKLEKWIEAGGKLVWISPSRKEAGIQFVDLSDDVRNEIRNWIHSFSSRAGGLIDQGHFKIVRQSQESVISAVLPAPKDDLIDIDAMFPSEKAVPPTRHPRVDDDATMAPFPTSSIELGIAPGPVKRRVVPSPAEAAISQQTPAASLDPSPQTPAAIEPPAPVRRSYHYPPLSIDSKTPGDPFASIAQEASAVVLPTAAAPPLRPTDPARHAATVLDEPIAPAFPLREHYRGLGYNPAPFEEPSGKGWLIAAAILVIVLAGGTVMALGPKNVKSVLGRHLPSISADGPPPPTGSMDKSPEPAAAAASRDSAESASFGGAPQPPLTNPGVGDSQQPDTTAAQTPPQVQVQAQAPPTVTTVTGKTSLNPPVEETPSQGIDARGETQEDIEAVTRRFQMEHSSSNARNVTNNAAAVSLPSSAHETSLSDAPGASTAGVSASESTPPRTRDAYSQPGPQNPAANNSVNSNVSSAGTVAVSSHFRSLRGEDPGTTQERQGLTVGQLISIHQPAYPVEAERSRTEGTVQLRATVDQLGKVEIVHAVSGPPLLLAAAVDAVREWRYAPTTVNGKAVESVNDVNVVFRLSNSVASPR